ncbi:competence protein CoiA family protein [Exiguobacterium sp. s193]|uniref:competence protein CoiA family protein n=1 Tax=Exiguobacterium sp. s193 TaxID=2751207 RepID=UPI001BE720B7|nr:competence protein CoiA family protein [Exiguobacterium sp. s193]
MFEAIDKSGRRINSQLIQAERLKQMELFCPYCLNRLRVRQGRKRIHFVHLARCTGESSAHLGWKSHLVRYFGRVGYLAELEKVHGQRRFDIWLPERRLGIEIQRSKMTREEWERRYRLDRQMMFEVRWIGFHPTSGRIIKLDGWMKQALQTNGYLDLIENGNINRYGYAIPFTKHLVICQRLDMSLAQFLTPTPEAFPRKFPLTSWIQMVRKYRMRPFFSSMPNHLLKQPLYEAGMHVLSLPALCFLPLTTLLAFRVHPFELQISIYLALRGTYTENRLTHALMTCLDTCRILYTSDVLQRVVGEWSCLIDIAQRLNQENQLNHHNRFEEDVRLAGAVQLFVEKETGI